MLRAVDLLRQGRREELWQMCCGFLSLSIDEFMGIQERLLLQQLELLGNSPLGKKIMRGASPKTVEEFRRMVPLTTYKDYTPELLDRREDVLPAKPSLWAHTSGQSGEYPSKWVPMTPAYAWELSKILYGVGIISSCNGWRDTSHIPKNIKILYSVAPRPYISGTFADLLTLQTPLEYLPSIQEAENLSYEERLGLGFRQAVSEGLDYFFGLSLVLVKVGDKLTESSNRIDLRPFMKSPRALLRLARGRLKSRLTGHALLPKDLWTLRGIIGSGVDSHVYKEKIKHLWGRPPLDLYSCTEGGVIATQAWDYEGMSFVPNLNFLEFIPEDEQLKNQMDRSYQPKTLLLNEVEAGSNYEMVFTNFHGGVMTRYRLGDMIRITALRDDKLGIDIPQMAFERRVDDFLDFYFITFNEKTIWKAIDSLGIRYEDWIAYKDAENMVLNIGIELKDDYSGKAEDMAAAIFRHLAYPEAEVDTGERHDDLMDIADFKIQVHLLPTGTFSRYMVRKQAEGADFAHLKVPHVNPPQKVLDILTAETEEIIVVSRTGTKVREKPGLEEAGVS